MAFQGPRVAWYQIEGLNSANVFIIYNTFIVHLSFMLIMVNNMAFLFLQSILKVLHIKHSLSTNVIDKEI